jgi:Tol biopolymer transport system component
VAPAWSPDGSRVVFAAFERWNAYPERQPNNEIFVLDVDSLEVANVTNSEALDDAMPSWSPGGERIVFVACPNDRLPLADSRTDYDVYVMDADGSNLTRLTDDPARDSGPAWSP